MQTDQLILGDNLYFGLRPDIPFSLMINCKVPHNSYVLTVYELDQGTGKIIQVLVSFENAHADIIIFSPDEPDSDEKPIEVYGLSSSDFEELIQITDMFAFREFLKNKVISTHVEFVYTK